MICPVCHHQDTKVVDSRVSGDGLSIRRRRECLKCSFRFSTYEEIEILDLIVVKRNGARESYSREKIISGLKKSLEKRPITDEEFKKVVHAIERDIQIMAKGEITTNQIGQLVMKHLKKVDQVAYIRFASVYESFKDAKDFKQELNKLLKNSKKNKKTKE